MKHDTNIDASIETIYDKVGNEQGAIAWDQTTDDNRPALSGFATSYCAVAIFDGEHLIGTVTAGSDGAWSFVPEVPLADGQHEFRVQAQNEHGQSSLSDAVEITVDTTAIAPGQLVINSLYNDVGFEHAYLNQGAQIDDVRPTLEGTAVAGSTVSIYDGSTLLGTANADAWGNWSFTPKAVLDEGVHHLTASLADGSVSAPFDVTVATPPPSISVVEDEQGDERGDFASGSIIDDHQPLFYGNGAADTLLTIYNGDEVLGTTNVSHEGLWSFTPEHSLESGTYKLVAMDAQGRSSAPFEVTVQDPASKHAPTIDFADHMVGNAWVHLENNATTDDPGSRLTGTTEPYGYVTVIDNSVFLGNAYADSSGAWNFAAQLGNGAHSLTVTAADGATSTPFVLTVQATVAAAPTIDSVYGAMGDSQDSLQSGATTDDGHLKLAGTAAAYSLVTITDGNVIIGRAAADSDGHWQLPIELPGGVHNLSAYTADAVANTSFVITVATVVIPVTPTIDLVYDDNQHGYVQNGATIDDASPQLSGTAAAYGSVTIADGSHTLATVQCDRYGNWSYTAELPDGTHNLTASTADGLISTPFVITIETVVAPVAPTIDWAYDAVGNSQGFLQSGATIDDTHPQLSGSAAAYSMVTIADGGLILGTARADAYGNWQFTPELANGTHHLTVSTADGVSSAPFVITVDTVVAPTIDWAYDDAGNTQGYLQSGATTDDTHPQLNGTAAAFSFVSINDADQVLGTVQADSYGNWQFAPELANGTHHLTVSTADGMSSVPFVITIETVVAPITPTIDWVYDDAANSPGYLQNGATISDTHPQLNGTAVAYSYVTIADGGQVLGTVQADRSGSWHFTATLPDGTHHLTASTADGLTSTSFVITVDTTPVMQMPTIEILYDHVGTNLGHLQSGASTNDDHPVMHGRAQANSEVTILDGNQVIGTVAVDDAGTWAYTPTLIDGTHILTISDNAGNTSAPFTITVVGHNLIAAPTITSVFDHAGVVQDYEHSGDTIADTRPSISGTAPAFTTVTIMDGTAMLGTVQTSAYGEWTFTPYQALSDGVHHIVAMIGGAPASVAFDLTIEVPPVAPTIGGVFDDLGIIAQDGATLDTHPTLTGTAEGDSWITIKDGNTELGKVQASAIGLWTFDNYPGDLAEGVHHLVAQSASGAASASFDFEVQIVTAPVVTLGFVAAMVDSTVLLNGSWTENVRPTLNGKGADANAIVTIMDDGHVIGTAKATVSGTWNFPLDTSLSDGLHHFTAEVGSGPVSEVFDLGVTSRAPLIMSVHDIAADCSYNHDEVVVSGNAVTLTGYGPVGGSVDLFDGSVLVGHAVIDTPSGQWSVDLSGLERGVHHLTITADNGKADTLPFNIDVEPVAADANVVNANALHSVLVDAGGELASTDHSHDTDTSQHHVLESQATGLSLPDVLSSNDADLFAPTPTHDSAQLNVRDIADAANAGAPQSAVAVTNYDLSSSHVAALLPQEVAHHAM